MRNVLYTSRNRPIPFLLMALFYFSALSFSEASVVYSSFLKGAKATEGNTLSWATKSETDCDFFLLEKSMDGIFFERVAILKASGDSDVERKYFYVDSLEKSMRVFYRVLQVDGDGTGAYSHSVVLSDKPVDAHFRMEYVENKTKQEAFEIGLYSQTEGTLSYRLMTQLGKLLLKGEMPLTAGSNMAQIDLSSVDVGTYQLALKVKNDIEVIAIKKEDGSLLPTVNLANKK